MPESFSSDLLQQEYELRFAAMAEYRNQVWKTILSSYLQKRIDRDQTILDLGSGWGEFINNVQAARKYAMDLNPEGAKRVAADVTFLQQDCSAPWGLEAESLGVVFTSNFFEHLPTRDALLETLQQAYCCLKPGGQIICLGPNIRYVGGAYWDFFDHYLQLTHLSMAEALRLTGFAVQSVVPRFLPYTMADGKRPPLIAVKLYLKLPLAWRFFGKQFLVTAVKPG